MDSSNDTGYPQCTPDDNDGKRKNGREKRRWKIELGVKLQNGEMNGTREAMNTGSEHQREKFSFTIKLFESLLQLSFFRGE